MTPQGVKGSRPRCRVKSIRGNRRCGYHFVSVYSLLRHPEHRCRGIRNSHRKNNQKREKEILNLFILPSLMIVTSKKMILDSGQIQLSHRDIGRSVF